MAPVPGWRLVVGGFRRNWSPRDAPPQGCDLLLRRRYWPRPRPRLEAAAWTESRGVELISVTAGKRPCRRRNDGGLVSRWGAEEREKGEERGRQPSAGAPFRPPSHPPPRSGHSGWPPSLPPLGALGEAISSPWGLPSTAAGGGDWGCGLVQSPANSSERARLGRGGWGRRTPIPRHRHGQHPGSLSLPGAGWRGVDVAEPPAPWRTTGTATPP